jgi:hypothetical protein
MRIRNFLLSWITAVTLVSLVGCAGTLAPPAHWKSVPDIVVIENRQFRVQLKPVWGSHGGCEAFVLGVVNKTNKSIKVNWNKTLYFSGDQTSGGFMFEGVVYKERNNPKPPDVVPGNASMTKTIWPNKLVYYVPIRGWRNEAMPEGDNGAYVSLSIDGKEVIERLVVRLSLVRH